VLGLELGCEHVRLISVSGHVARAHIDSLINLAFLSLQGLAVDDGNDRELLLRDGLFHLSRVLLPGSTFELETENVGTILNTLEHARNLRLPVELLLDISLDVKLVKSLSGLLGTDLLNGSEVRVRLVESVQEADGLVNRGWVILPQVKHFQSLLQVIEPGSETSGGHPGLLGPLSADSVERNVLHQIFHSGSHGQLSLEGKLKVLEVNNDDLDEGVDQLALLQVDILVRSTSRFIRQLAIDFVNGELLALNLGLFEDSNGEFLGNINDSGSTISATATTLGLKLDQDSEQVNALGGQEINFSIGMHSESKRSLSGQFVLNVLKVLGVSGSNRALERSLSFGEGEELSLVKECIVEEVLEVGGTEVPIPIVNDMSSVHDLSNEILEIIPWHFTGTTGTIHIVLEHDRGITEITIREGVSHVESLRSELSTLTHDGVEVSETEEHSSNLGLLLVEFLSLVGHESSVHVGLESSWGLVGQLDGLLKEINWNSNTGIRCQEDSESRVGSLSNENFHSLSEFEEETGHQMHVLEHNPLSFFVSHIEELVGNNILTLSKGDLGKLFGGVESVVDSKSLNILNGVGSRRKDEVDRSGRGRVSVRGEENFFSRAGGITLNEFLTVRESLGDEVTESDSNTIGSEASSDKHLLERQRFESLPVKRKFLDLRGKIVVPVLESTRSFLLKVSGELLESVKFDQTLDAVPGGLRKPLLEGGGARSISAQWAVHEECHLSCVVLGLKLSLLHESEGQQRKEDLLVAFEKTTSDPLVNVNTDLLDEIEHAGVVIIIGFSSFNSLEEINVERLKRVLIHVVNNAKLDEQEVEHSTFSRHSSVYFTRDSNSLLGNLGNNLLLLNGSGGLFGDF